MHTVIININKNIFFKSFSILSLKYYLISPDISDINPFKPKTRASFTFATI